MKKNLDFSTLRQLLSLAKTYNKKVVGLCATQEDLDAVCCLFSAIVPDTVCGSGRHFRGEGLNISFMVSTKNLPKGDLWYLGTEKKG